MKMTTTRHHEVTQEKKSQEGRAQEPVLHLTPAARILGVASAPEDLNLQ
jgi:hypothetical protein